MDKKGPIIVIEDDEDDRDMFKYAFSRLSLSNKLIMFPNADEALQFISSMDVYPFLIISDINMPGLTGLQLRNRLFEDPRLREKAIPFVFLTTSTDRDVVKQAYSLPVQGIFTKPNSVAEYEQKIRTMLEYWEASLLL